MAQCPRCGNYIQDGVSVCPYCNTQLYHQVPLSYTSYQPYGQVPVPPPGGMGGAYNQDYLLQILAQKENTNAMVYIITGIFACVVGVLLCWMIWPIFAAVVGGINIYTGTQRKQHSQSILYQPYGIYQYYQSQETKCIILIVAGFLFSLICMVGPICDLSTKSFVMQNQAGFMQIEQRRYARR